MIIIVMLSGPDLAVESTAMALFLNAYEKTENISN